MQPTLSPCVVLFSMTLSPRTDVLFSTPVPTICGLVFSCFFLQISLIVVFFVLLLFLLLLLWVYWGKYKVVLQDIVHGNLWLPNSDDENLTSRSLQRSVPPEGKKDK